MLYEIDGATPQIHSTAYVAPTADLIGNVEVAGSASVWFGSVLRADQNVIQVGARSNVQDGAVVHADGPTTGGRPCIIGSDVTVGHQVHLHGCKLENGCLIGSGSVILDNAVVPRRTLVAAGSLVLPTSKLEPESLVAGSPAKVVRALTSQELLELDSAAASYVRLRQVYLSGLRLLTPIT